jgi:bifunctional non-homologous end joining protein LigD
LVKTDAIDPKIPGARKAEMPTRLSPMLATLTGGPFTDSEWYFEPKLDGYRIIAFVRDGKSMLQSRNLHDYTLHFPVVAAEMDAQPVEQALFDGELVALDEKSRPCFQCLQQHVKQERGEAEVWYTLHYYVFDLLHLNGYDLTGATQSDRVALLDKVLKPGKAVKAVSRLQGDGTEIFNAAIQTGMEGLVAKKRDAIYQPGKRSNEWLKIKGTLSDEFVIVGYSVGQGARAGAFGSMVLAQYDDNGKLQYTSNVGTGFNEALLEGLKIKMDELQADHSPFDYKIPFESKITWLKPEMVAEVKFSERTRDGGLRAPVFLRLRDDKPAKEVHRQANSERG